MRASCNSWIMSCVLLMVTGKGSKCAKPDTEDPPLDRTISQINCPCSACQASQSESQGQGFGYEGVVRTQKSAQVRPESEAALLEYSTIAFSKLILPPVPLLWRLPPHQSPDRTDRQSSQWALDGGSEHCFLPLWLLSLLKDLQMRDANISLDCTCTSAMDFHRHTAALAEMALSLSRTTVIDHTTTYPQVDISTS